MALFDSGTPLANVALSDTFNTWRVRTNQINTQAAGLASNNTFTGTLNTFNNTASFKGPVTAPIVTANTVNGTTANFTTLQADSIDFDGDLTVDGITANTAAFAGPVTAPIVTANTVNATAANFTTLQADAIDFDGDLTVDQVTANTLAGTISTAAQPNITSVGTLTSIATTGPFTGPTVAANTVAGTTVAGTVGTKSDVNIAFPVANTITFSTSAAEKARIDKLGYWNAVFSDDVVALGNSGTATTITCTQGNVFTCTLNGNCTFTLAAPSTVTSSTATSFTLVLTNDGTAGRTVAFSGGTFKYPGGSVTRSTGANDVDIWFFFSPDGGTTWYVNIAMKDLS